MRSPIYWHPFLYQAAIKLSFGSRLKARYFNLQKHIPANSNLLELCMGDAFLYLNYLKQKNINYTCVDVNTAFINSAKKKGINCLQMNVETEEIPKSDYILMQGSLYHFIPHQKQIIQKLLDACNKELIISENIKNLSNHNSALKSYLGKIISNAGYGQSKIKFTKSLLEETFSDFKSRIKIWEELPDNNEIIIVLNKF